MGGCEDPRANGVGIDLDVERDWCHLDIGLQEEVRSTTVERQCGFDC